jgi:hypothetical protein
MMDLTKIIWIIVGVLALKRLLRGDKVAEDIIIDAENIVAEDKEKKSPGNKMDKMAIITTLIWLCAIPALALPSASVTKARCEARQEKLRAKEVRRHLKNIEYLFKNYCRVSERVEDVGVADDLRTQLETLGYKVQTTVDCEIVLTVDTP